MNAITNDASLAAEMRTALNQAEAAYSAIAQHPTVAQNLELFGFWNTLHMASSAARSPYSGDPQTQREAERKTTAAQRDIWREAADLLGGVAADLLRVAGPDVAALRQVYVSPGARRDALRPLLARYAGLAAWQSRQDAEAERQAQRQATASLAVTATADAAKAAARQTAALALLRRLGADGVRVVLAKGALSAHPPALLTEEHRRDVREFAPELRAVLAADAETIA